MKNQKVGDFTVKIKFTYGPKYQRADKIITKKAACKVDVEEAGNAACESAHSVVEINCPKGNFCREDIRKKTLRNTLEASGMGKSLRAIVWAAYFQRIPAGVKAVNVEA